MFCRRTDGRRRSRPHSRPSAASLLLAASASPRGLLSSSRPHVTAPPREGRSADPVHCAVSAADGRMEQLMHVTGADAATAAFFLDAAGGDVQVSRPQSERPCGSRHAGRVVRKAGNAQSGPAVRGSMSWIGSDRPAFRLVLPCAKVRGRCGRERKPAPPKAGKGAPWWEICTRCMRRQFAAACTQGAGQAAGPGETRPAWSSCCKPMFTIRTGRTAARAGGWTPLGKTRQYFSITPGSPRICCDERGRASATSASEY